MEHCNEYPKCNHSAADWHAYLVFLSGQPVQVYAQCDAEADDLARRKLVEIID